MIYKLITSLFLLLIVLIMYNDEIVAQDYYPLEIGNRWDYEKTFHIWPNPPEIDTFSVEVIDDSLFLNGKIYYVLDNWDLTGGRYVRADSDFVYYFDENESEEDTLYRLNAQPGDEWFLHFGATTIVRLDSISTSQIFSISTILQYYRLDGLILGYVILSDKFGPIHFHSPGEPPGTSFTGITLISCFIDSIQYGIPVTLGNELNVISGYSLEQNFPNPFNPSTKINYEVPDLSFVTLKVYDVLGNEFATLVNEEKPAGSYDVEFSVGRDTSPDIATGIYFYRIQAVPSGRQAGNFIETKKMILLK